MLPGHTGLATRIAVFPEHCKRRNNSFAARP